MMARSKLIGYLFIALLILNLAFASRSSHRRLQSSNADASSSSGIGSSWSSSWSVSGSGYKVGVDCSIMGDGGQSCCSRSCGSEGGGGGGGGGGRGGENGGGGGGSGGGSGSGSGCGGSDFKVVTRGSGTEGVEGGSTIHGNKVINKGGSLE